MTNSVLGGSFFHFRGHFSASKFGRGVRGGGSCVCYANETSDQRDRGHSAGHDDDNRREKPMARDEARVLGGYFWLVFAVCFGSLRGP